jgi:CubicO group peptidase (beta-lactamase class C family)
MRTRPSLLALVALLLLAGPLAAQRPYVPPAGATWERRAPESLGMDPALLRQAVEYAVAQESRAPRDLEAAHHRTFAREPFGEPIGPFRERGDPTGIVLRGGYIVAEWGDVERVDMTFSVTKSFLSTVVGLAWARGTLRVDEPVHRAVAPIEVIGTDLAGPSRAPDARGARSFLLPFDTEHNRRITWDHLLRQTSDWEGTLWGKPEWSDRPSANPDEWGTRPRLEPGTAYEYNDVRVNVLALAATDVWRRPLPQVLREELMDPIGASSTWRWLGYDHSWILLDGAPVQVVSGGGHWGGGMFISALDLARFGLLTQRLGRWGDRQILPEEWLRMALTPTPAQPDYGHMNFLLNTGRQRFPSAPASAFAHLGAGTNMVYVDRESDLVIVARWIQNDQLDGLTGRVLAAVRR